MSRPQSDLVTYALDLVAYHGYTPYRAAKETGIAFSTIYRAIQRHQPKKAKRKPK